MWKRLQESDWMDFVLIGLSAVFALSILIWVQQTNQKVEADKLTVPDVRWMTVVEAHQVLSDAGFENFEFTAQGTGNFLGAKPGWDTRYPETWVIVKQVPAPGEKASASGANLHFFAYQEGSTGLQRAKSAEGKE